MAEMKFDCETVLLEAKVRAEADPLKPINFRTNAGRKGWMVRIPGHHRLATPAIATGRVLLGGGFGSYEFYAFDAKTGEKLWQMHTEDDGPTAAVVYDGVVAFNTESCTLIVCDAATGRERWHRWLGDPLMSQPAVVLIEDRPYVVMVYPTGGAHRIAAFDLYSGEKRWETELTLDVISAPIAVDDKIYVSLMNGDIVDIDAATGAILSVDKEAGATSAPWVDGGVLFYSRRDESLPRLDPSEAPQSTEGLDTIASLEGLIDLAECTAIRAGEEGDYVRRDYYRRRARYLRSKVESLKAAQLKDELAKADADVGFAQTPHSAKLDVAQEHLGYRASTVGGAWGYQGSRPVVAHGRVYAAIGGVIRAQDRTTGETLWEMELYDETIDYHALTPVAVAGNCVYTATVDGIVLALEATSGAVKWAVRLPSARIEFQPAIQDGRVYIGTAYGWLYCLDAQDPTADGWPMWGGGPGHNGPLPDRSKR